MNWRYEWISELDEDVYSVLVEMLQKETDE